MNIDNFSAAIIAAAAYSRHRDISAVDAANVRHDDEGALIVRPGYRRMPSDNEQVVSIFAHWGYVLVVTHAGELKWDTEQRLIDAQAGDSLFRSFIPARTGFDVSSRTHFIANENDVFLSNANSQLKVIFHNETESVAFPFYLPPLQGVNIHSAEQRKGSEPMFQARVYLCPAAVADIRWGCMSGYSLSKRFHSRKHTIGIFRSKPSVGAQSAQMRRVCLKKSLYPAILSLIL